MVEFYKIWKKYNEIQLKTKQDGLEQSKNKKIIHPPLVMNNLTTALWGRVQNLKPTVNSMQILCCFIAVNDQNIKQPEHAVFMFVSH